LEVTASAWVATIALIIVLLGVDLAIGALRPHAVGFAEAAAWSVFYIAVALAFGVVLGLVAGWEVGSQYFAGYLVEKSLSVDNLFVFVVIMSTFAVPPPRRGPRGRRQRPGPQRPEGAADHHRVPGWPARHPGRRPASGHAPVHCPGQVLPRPHGPGPRRLPARPPEPARSRAPADRRSGSGPSAPS
jgi:hypothetical protein